MLEQQDSADCDYGAETTIIPNKGNGDNDSNNTVANGFVNNGISSPEATNVGNGVATTLSSPASTSSTTTTTTTVRIHTTYKKRANKFMNRPNVQNGLGANSMLHPYGVTVSSGLGVASGGPAGGHKILNHSSYTNNGHSHHSPQLNSLFGSGNRNNSHSSNNHHRSLTTRSSLLNNDGGGSGGGSITSPQGTATTASTTTAAVESRPPFVTTVTRGRFLPSKFDLMVEKSLFTFSSRPKPVGLITRHQCSLSGGPSNENDASQNCQPRGAHDYFNVMWDPHIYRGTTTTLTSSLKQPERDLSNKDQDRYRRRRAFLAGQNNVSNGNLDRNSSNNNSNHLNPVSILGPGSNRNRYRMTTKVTSRARTFPPPEGRHQVHVQTEDYLEDLTRDVTNKAPDVDAIVQTDPIEDDDLVSASALTRSVGGELKSGRRILPKSGIDASTQVLPGELTTFDERVQPIVEAVVGKILEQALLETMEEEEIGALKAQQNRFLEKRKEEERELKRLQEQQERISAEKERLKRHLEMQLTRQQQQQTLQSQNGGNDEAQLSSTSTTPLMMENGGNANETTANAMSTSYLLELLPSVINSLRQEGLITDQIGDEVLTSFVPLWMRSNREEGSAEIPTGFDRAGADEDDDDEIDAFDPFPDGCRSRMNSLDIVSLNGKDSAIPSPSLGPEEVGAGESNEQAESNLAEGENQNEAEDPSETQNDEKRAKCEETEEERQDGELEENEANDDENGALGESETVENVAEEALADTTEDSEMSRAQPELDEDPSSVGNIASSTSLSLPSQLPNGVIPNMESREN